MPDTLKDDLQKAVERILKAVGEKPGRGTFYRALSQELRDNRDEAFIQRMGKIEKIMLALFEQGEELTSDAIDAILDQENESDVSRKPDDPTTPSFE